MEKDLKKRNWRRELVVPLVVLLVTVVVFVSALPCFATDPDVVNVIDSVKISIELIKDSMIGKVSHLEELEPGVYVVSGKNRQLVMVVAQPICLECLAGMVYVAPMKDLLPEDVRKAMELTEPEKKEHSHD